MHQRVHICNTSIQCLNSPKQEDSVQNKMIIAWSVFILHVYCSMVWSLDKCLLLNNYDECCFIFLYLKLYSASSAKVWIFNSCFEIFNSILFICHFLSTFPYFMSWIQKYDDKSIFRYKLLPIRSTGTCSTMQYWFSAVQGYGLWKYRVHVVQYMWVNAVLWFKAKDRHK